jgi:hypothetical protein
MTRRCLLPLLAVFLPAAAAGQVTVSPDISAPAAEFGAAEIRRALAAHPDSGRSLQFVIGTKAPAGIRPPRHSVRQSYALRRNGSTWYGIGSDAAGAMYAALDLAELVRTGAIRTAADIDSAPHIANRGIKFNIPLDARTPSYSDNSDAAQQNIPEMWSMDFWHEFLDDMARHRYNVLSLWNLHPFPSLVKVPEYPDVALDDVMRTTHPLDDSYSHTGNDMVRPEILANLQPVRRMSIDEKIRFWRDVMQYAKDRGVDIYLFTWNIFTWGAEGKHGITKAQDNATTIDYFRKSVRETVLTYPLLAGIGITAGEQMQTRKDEFDKEKWLWKTYGEGIRDALKQQPNRRFRLIHRFHQTALGAITNEWKNYPGPFDLSFKYAIAHMYSIPNPSFIQSALPHLSKELRSWLTVRNDDIYSFRWADPEFARAFIRHIPGPDKIAGFYMGPDGYIWGRDFLSREGGARPQTVMQKQWFSFLLWGRLSYDPSLPDERLHQILSERFPQVSAKQLLSAWSEASRVFPEITRFSWGDIDLRWFPEACISHPRYKGFYTVRHFMEGGTMPGANVLDILTWRSRLRNGNAMEGTTPLQIAASLKSHADSALPQLPALRAKAANARELRQTLNDVEAMSHLANYYGEKILGASRLALFDQSSDTAEQQAAVGHLRAALEHWKRYAAVYSSQYKPQLLNRVGFVDIPKLTAKVEQDIAIASSWQPGTLREPDPRSRRGDNPFRP